MYSYNEYVPLSVEEILKRTTEEEIFGIVIQEEIIEDKGALYKAPYRNDTHADCWFDRYNGHLWFIDFAKGSGKPGMSCFDFIKKTYNLTFKEALQFISDELELGLGDNLGKAKKIVHETGIVEERNVKKIFKERVITYLPRPFNYKDKQFWSKYEITKQNLKEDGVIPIEIYQSTSRQGKKFSVRPFKVCYAYTKFYDLEGNLLENKVKIYTPYAPKDAKWFTNCNQNDIGGLYNLPKSGKVLIITKSYKDYRVLLNLGLNVIWFQNEGQIPNKKILIEIVSRFEEIVVWFDNDSTGITNSRIVKEYVNDITSSSKARSLFLPPKLLSFNIKDPSDYLAKRNREVLLDFINKNNLLK